MIHSEGERLFGKYELRLEMENQDKEMSSEISKIDGNRLLNTSIEDLCDYFEGKYLISVPQIIEDKIQVDHKEIQVDVSQDRNRFFVDRSQSYYISGTNVIYFVPFQGDKNVFQCRPSTFTLNPPVAYIEESEIKLSYVMTTHDESAVKSAFNRDLSEIRKWLEWIAKDVEPFNKSIKDKAHKMIETRRNKLLNDQGLVANLGFPLRRREDNSHTYNTAVVRRKVIQTPIPKSNTPFTPEPTLGVKEYDHILTVISNMVIVMERSPKAFHQMVEEDLRQHFLVQLNGQYEGQATGETFNYEGKTDILIRVEGKNIFIAECKFWRGPSSLTEAVNQLLSYTSWRDTKTAILIFNREKSFTSVISKIPEVIKEHPNFKREIKFNSETGFRFVFSHRDDPNRELILTILAFEVPA